MKIAKTMTAIGLVVAGMSVAGCADLYANGEYVGGGPAYGFYDVNDDGLLSSTEYAGIDAGFDTYDVDDSGFIDNDEFGAWSNDTWGTDIGYDQTAGLYDDWDDDGDGLLSDDEWGGGDEFLAWDEDGSGVLEEDEGWF